MGNRNMMGRLVFLSPFIILMFGFAAYALIIPHIYGKVISFGDWLMGDPENIIQSLRNPNIILPQVHRVILLKVLWWIWLASFICSLFFVGRRLHSQPEPNDVDSILVRNEPYQMMREVREVLLQAMSHENEKSITSLVSSVKILEEKLLSETDFGYGSTEVIRCENDIARNLQFLAEIAHNIRNGDSEEKIREMKKTIGFVGTLLRKRMEMKKKR